MPQIESQRYSRSPGVTVSVEGRVLVVPARDGVVDLAEVVCLDGVGARVWTSLEAEFSIEKVAALLEREGADGGSSAMADASSFVGELAGRGLCAGEAVRSPITTEAAGVPANPPELDADAMLDLVRRVLADGYTLRFVARGASMQPQVPDNSALEVSPRGFDSVRVGEIALYTTAGRLVAHRVQRREGSVLIARGDSAARIDRVSSDSFLGVVTARLVRGADGVQTRVDLGGAGARAAGRAHGFLHRARSACARIFVVAPLRRAPWLRRVLRWVLGLGSELLRRSENRAFRLRHRIDIARAALLTTAEKDVDRRTLYAKKSVREFTALDENVEAGFTLLEEVLLSRHPIAPGRALVVGCGPGRECVAFAKLGFRVTGVDYDRAMLDHAAELAKRHGVDVDLVHGAGEELEVPGEPFDVVVIFSGLYNMVLPRARRVAMLHGAREHLVPGGQVLVTFLSDYVRPGAPPPADVPDLWTRVNADHQVGDRYLINEAIHVFPHESRLRAEARDAGLTVEVLHRDQRAYERATRQVRGFAVLRRSD